MNIFRLSGDLSHLASYLILLYVLFKKRNASGISLKTQQLYFLVFIARYLDLFTNFYSLYNTLFKIFYILASGAICWLIMYKEPWRSSNDRSNDTFRIILVIAPSFVLALLFNYEYSVMEILWTFSIYLEAVAIVPQLFVLHRTSRIENFTSHYVFTLGAYRGLYILNWIYRFFSEYYYRQWIVWIAGVVQTALYVDFFYHYWRAKKQGLDKDVLLPTKQ
eukprot:g2946.t1